MCEIRHLVGAVASEATSYEFATFSACNRKHPFCKVCVLGHIFNRSFEFGKERAAFLSLEHLFRLPLKEVKVAGVHRLCHLRNFAFDTTERFGDLDFNCLFRGRFYAVLCHIPCGLLLLSRQIFVSLAAVNFLTRCKGKHIENINQTFREFIFKMFI